MKLLWFFPECLYQAFTYQMKGSWPLHFCFAWAGVRQISSVRSIHSQKVFQHLSYSLPWLHLTNHLYGVELVRPEIEHRETILVGFKFYKMLSRDCWNFFAISKSSVTLTSKKNLKWTDISTLLCQKKTWKTLFSAENGMSGLQCA